MTNRVEVTVPQEVLYEEHFPCCGLKLHPRELRRGTLAPEEQRRTIAALRKPVQVTQVIHRDGLIKVLCPHMREAGGGLLVPGGTVFCKASGQVPQPRCPYVSPARPDFDQEGFLDALAERLRAEEVAGQGDAPLSEVVQSE